MSDFMVMGLVSGWSLTNHSKSVFPGGAHITQPRWMLARKILGSGRTRNVSFRPFPNSSGWWWLIRSVFLIRISCHKTTHADGDCGAWPGWAVSISVLPLILLCLLLVHACVLSFQSCLTLCNPMDCSLPGSSIHGFLQARILKWVAMPSSRVSS